MEITILSQKEIKKVLELEKVIEGVEKVYGQKANNQTVTWPSVEYHFENQNAAMDIRSGYIQGEKLHGAKMLNNFPQNMANDLPAFTGMLMIFDSNTGLPVGILDASYITSMRTGAAAALGAKALARKDSKTLLLVGAGRQAFYMLAATLHTLPQLEKVLVIDPLSHANAAVFAEGFAQRAKEELSLDIKEGLEFLAVENMQTAVKEADIIITITRSTEPLIQKEWVQPGTHFSCIGADMKGKEEIDPEIFKTARSFADDIHQCISFGEMEIPHQLGIISKESVIGEIGEVLVGKKQGRLHADDITVFDATGLALLDLITGKLAIDLAKAKGFGTRVDI